MRVKSIELENFRDFSRKKINFPDTPLIVLSDDNGKGKTSLFEAILVALKGDISWYDDSTDYGSVDALFSLQAGEKDRMAVSVVIGDTEQNYKIGINRPRRKKTYLTKTTGYDINHFLNDKMVDQSSLSAFMEDNLSIDSNTFPHANYLSQDLINQALIKDPNIRASVFDKILNSEWITQMSNHIKLLTDKIKSSRSALKKEWISATEVIENSEAVKLWRKLSENVVELSDTLFKNTALNTINKIIKVEPDVFDNLARDEIIKLVDDKIIDYHTSIKQRENLLKAFTEQLESLKSSWKLINDNNEKLGKSEEQFKSINETNEELDKKKEPLKELREKLKPLLNTQKELIDKFNTIESQYEKFMEEHKSFDNLTQLINFEKKKYDETKTWKDKFDHIKTELETSLLTLKTEISSIKEQELKLQSNIPDIKEIKTDLNNGIEILKKITPYHKLDMETFGVVETHFKKCECDNHNELLKTIDILDKQMRDINTEEIVKSINNYQTYLVKNVTGGDPEEQFLQEQIKQNISLTEEINDLEDNKLKYNLNVYLRRDIEYFESRLEKLGKEREPELKIQISNEDLNAKYLKSLDKSYKNLNKYISSFSRTKIKIIELDNYRLKLSKIKKENEKNNAELSSLNEKLIKLHAECQADLKIEIILKLKPDINGIQTSILIIKKHIDDNLETLKKSIRKTEEIFQKGKEIEKLKTDQQNTENKSKYNTEKKKLTELEEQFKKAETDWEELETEFKELSNKREEMKKSASTLKHDRDEAKRILTTFHTTYNIKYELDKGNVEEWEITLNKQIRDIPEIVEVSSNELQSIHTQLEQKDKFDKILEEEYAVINKAKNRKDEIQSHAEYYKSLENALKMIKKEIDNQIKDYLEDMKDEIETDFKEIFEKMGGHQRFNVFDFNIKMYRNKLKADLNVGIKSNVGTPKALLSNGQQVSVVLSLFLATLKAQLKAGGFSWVAMDEPTQYLDTDKKTAFANILLEFLKEYPNTQIMIATADKEFISMLGNLKDNIFKMAAIFNVEEDKTIKLDPNIIVVTENPRSEGDIDAIPVDDIKPEPILSDKIGEKVEKPEEKSGKTVICKSCKKEFKTDRFSSDKYCQNAICIRMSEDTIFDM